jgi:D-alanine-D-alanine ligase-like ATP-grasp enzyme
LIDRENETREAMDLYPVIHPLAKDANTVRFLKKKGLTLTSVPKNGERLTLHNRISLAAGGVVETIDKNSVHPKNRQLLLRIPGLFQANILGIDAIFANGIEFAHDEQQVIFLEVNSRPYLKMHDFPRYGHKEDLQPYFRKLESLDIGEKDIY